MANTLKFGNGQWATKVGSTLAYNDENGNFKPLPFNFTRSTGGTRVNKDGLIEVVTNNKPRIDFLNDSNGALLLEPSRTNLATYSEQFDNAAWTKFGGVVLANTETSPDGAINSDTLEGDGSTVQIIISQGKTLSAGQFTSSIFAKAGTANFLELTFDNFVGASNISGVFDLSNGTTSSVGAIIQSFNNGWYRCSLTATIVSGDVVGSLGYRIRPNAANIFYPNAAATNGQNVFLYGSQIEAGSYATSYIPTQGATATRVAEVCIDAGNNQVINSTEGVLYVEIAALVTSGENRVITISDGSSNNSSRIQLYTNTNEIEMRTVVGGVVQALERVAISNTLNFNKIAYKYKANDFQLYVNGSKLRFDTSGSVSAAGTYNAINFDDGSGSAIFYGKARDIRVYNEALTDAELISLTTL
jgi:hypothetical protein